MGDLRFPQPAQAFGRQRDEEAPKVVRVLLALDQSLREPRDRAGQTGPGAIGFADVARILARVLGQEVSYAAVPHEAALEAMKGMGVPEWIAEGYVALNRGFEAGFADTTTPNVERLTGRPPRSGRPPLT